MTFLKIAEFSGVRLIIFCYHWKSKSSEIFVNGMASTIRRLSCIPEAISQAIKDEASLQVPKCGDRRPSLQEIEDSALLFLERRKSSDSGIGKFLTEVLNFKNFRNLLFSFLVSQTWNESDFRFSKQKWYFLIHFKYKITRGSFPS